MAGCKSVPLKRCYPISQGSQYCWVFLVWVLFFCGRGCLFVFIILVYVPGQILSHFLAMILNSISFHKFFNAEVVELWFPLLTDTSQEGISLPLPHRVLVLLLQSLPGSSYGPLPSASVSAHGNLSLSFSCSYKDISPIGLRAQLL